MHVASKHIPVLAAARFFFFFFFPPVQQTTSGIGHRVFRLATNALNVRNNNNSLNNNNNWLPDERSNLA